MTTDSAEARSGVRLSWTDRIIEGEAILLLAFAPLAYGAVEAWSEAIVELLVVGMALIWFLGMVLGQREPRVALPAGWLPAVLFLVLVLLQAVPLPAGLLERLSPWSVHLHRTAAEHVGGAGDLVPLSLAAHATRREALRLASAALFLLVCYNTYRTRGQVTRALWTMVLMGTLISVFGIVQRMTWNGRLYWIGPEAPASAFGPFVNRAHFAGLMVVVIPMTMALMLGSRSDSGGRWPTRRWVERLRQWNSTQAGPTRLIPFLLALMGGATLVSGSRGGVVALMAALLTMAGLGTHGRPGSSWAGRLAASISLIVLAGLWIGGDVLQGTVERLAEEVWRPEGGWRLGLWREAVALWQGVPLLGTGLGSFGDAYPLVRTLRAPVWFSHADSDWVQLLTDTGGLGLALAVTAAGAFGLALVRRCRRPPGPGARVLALAGVVAIVGAAVQGIGNYNLAVTSNLLYLAVACVAAACGSARSAGTGTGLTRAVG